MPISGLVLTLDPHACPDQVRAQVLRLPGVDLVDPGRAGGRRVALVLDTPDSESDRRAWQALQASPGVRHIDVVYIHFDQPDATLPHRSNEHARLR